MCVIIDREAGVEIPFDKLEQACDINKHGFGLSWVEKNKIKTIRNIANNDAQAIHKELKSLSKKHVFLHLRHATKGDVIIENSHPFLGLDDQLGFMHNGTLMAWDPTDKQFSDSKCFFDSFLEPLSERISLFATRKKLLFDFIYRRVIAEECSGFSVFVIFDAFGNSLRYGEKHGKQFQGWWASNDYSFDSQHMRSSKRTPYVGGKSVYPFPLLEDKSQEKHTTLLGDTGGTTATTIFPLSVDRPRLDWDNFAAFGKNNDTDFASLFRTTPLQDALSAIANEVWSAYTNDDKETLMAEIQAVLTKVAIEREPFLEATGLKDFKHVCMLTPADFAELCANYPKGMAELFVDMAAVLIQKGIVSQ